MTVDRTGHRAAPTPSGMSRFAVARHGHMTVTIPLHPASAAPPEGGRLRLPGGHEVERRPAGLGYGKGLESALPLSDRQVEQQPERRLAEFGQQLLLPPVRVRGDRSGPVSRLDK